MTDTLKPFLVALDGHPEVADLIAERAEEAGFEALALQDRLMLETTVAVAAADVLVVDTAHVESALKALERQEQAPLVILMIDHPVSGALTPVGLAAEVVATLTKPLTEDTLREALERALRGVSRNGSGG